MSASDTITTSGFERPRLVSKKVLAKSQNEGKGAVVRRSIGRPELTYLDPFLLLDEFAVSPPAGFPNHPHRGFETVTYMLQGAFTHQDFAGHKGTVRTGDVQWMTAGRGIIHSEMPAGEGTHSGLQLWINLSSKDKMIEPRYQELLSEDVPKAEKNGVEVKIIAGETMGVHSPVCTQTPTMYLDFTLKPNTEYHQSIPESWNAFVYIIEGEGVFDSQNSAPIKAHHLLVLGPGKGLSVWNKSSEPLRFILVGGQPLNEPVVQHGPFVMNTQAEIDKTIEDYYYGKNGFEMARHWIPQ
ncbi:Pirin-like protein [Abeliophyllum distichum]|uniref:Pirin-like protein n=1 Tax=Abeliophyllum distichum TaxID=126358 RepID=A0ABD1T0T2_9LAMI